ncbi:MAG: hypothetical protein OET90_11905 [Desulfuromonadales bacterium]|nr:hypothetical protein [Desulfuromonadales bacterium]
MFFMWYLLAMKNYYTIVFTLVGLAMITGCATGTGASSRAQQPKEDPDLIRLQCKVAYDRGCRHQGRVFPWGAWLDVQGYDSRDYELKQVVREGPGATVLVLPRPKAK